jgi:hypothetical protein
VGLSVKQDFRGRGMRGFKLAAGRSSLALVALSQPAYAACTPNPTQAYVTTTCSGLTSDGIVVSTSGSSVQVTSGAQLQAGTAVAGALFSSGNYLSVDGTIAGGSKPGVIVTNGAPLVITSYSDYDPYAGAAPYYLPFGSTFYPSEYLQINISGTGAISGSSAISLQQRSDNSSGTVFASITNAGTLTGSAGPALVAGTGSAFGITNQASAVIGGISGALTSLSNAGLIDGGTGSAVSIPSGSYYAYGNIQNSGRIVSNSTSATIVAGPDSISNSGTIANSGTGAAIVDTQSLSITNSGTGTISTAGSIAIQTSNVLQLTNRGTITGSVIAGSSGSSGSRIDTVGGTIHGDLLLGGGNDQLIATLDANNHIVEVSGTVDGGGGVDTFTVQISADTTLASATLPTNFERLDLSLANNASVTLGTSFAAPFGMSIGGSGTLTVTGNIASTGSAFTSSFSSYGYGLSLVNNGTITSTLSDITQSAVSLPFYGGINNAGTITAIGGGGVVISGQNAVNSGTITADGTALNIFSGGGNNSGTITSNRGVGLLFSGSQNQFTNSGTITGQTAGAVIGNVTLVNTGTIGSSGRGVALQYYGMLDNRAGGIVNGGVGTLQASDFLYNARVINAGTINGDVNFGNVSFGYGSSNIFVAASGGIVNGNLYLGSGNDLFVTSLTNNGSGQFAGVTGTVNGSGSETIRYLVDQDATTTLSTAGIFANVGYQLSNNAKLTLSASAAQALSVDLAGSGTVDLTADISQAGDRSILNLNATPALATSTSTANALDVTSHGTLTQSHTQTYSYAAPAVVLSTGSSFTNAGTIIVREMAPNSYSGITLAAIAGTGTVVNSGTISVDGAIAVLNNGYYYGNLDFTNSGSIVQASNGADGQGVSGATTITNSGSIVTGAAAITIVPSYNIQSRVTNSGVIQSLHSSAIVGGYDYISSIVANQASGVITGGGGKAAILLFPGSTVDNAGTINGDVNLNALPYYQSTSSSTYISNGGTLNGNLTFGAGNDIFVAFNNAGTGVSGTIDAGAGVDTYGLAYSSSTSITPGGTLPSSFEKQAFGAIGNGTTLTITGPAGGLSSGLQLFGDGTIVNQADISAAPVISDPYYYYYYPYGTGNNAVILGGISGQSFASSLSFINNANIANGAQGTVSSFTNNGTAGSTSLPYSAVSLSAAAAGDSFHFLNSGTISSGNSSCQYYYCSLPSAVSIQNQNSSKAIASVSIENTGTITGGITTSTVSQDYSFKNGGTITAPSATYYTPAAVSISSGSSYNYLYDSTSIIVPNGRSAAIDNSGTINGTLSANIVASDLAVRNSGTISVDNPFGTAVYLSLGTYQVNDFQNSKVTTTYQNSATISNSGTIAGAVYLRAAAGSVTASNSGTITVPATPANAYYPGSVTALTLAAASNTNVAVAMSNSGTIANQGYGGAALGISATATTNSSGIAATAAVAGGVTSTVKVINDGILKVDSGALVGTGYSSTYLTPAAALAISAHGDGGSVIDITNGVNGVISATGVPVTYLYGAKVASGPITTAGSIAIAASADTVTLHNAGTITGSAGTTLPANTNVTVGNQSFDGSGQFLAGAIQTFNSADTVINAKTGTITGSIDLGTGNDHVENYGNITGNIYLRDGDDSFVQSIGGALNGIADGGSGTNSLKIDVTGGGMLAQTLLDKFVNFAAPQIIGSGAIMIGGPLAIDTLRLDNASLTISAGQTLQTTGPMSITGSGDVHLVNNGTIMGAVDLGNGNSSLDDSGRIAGTINFGSGADQLIVRHGAVFGGTVSGGGGSDMVILAEGGSDAAPEELNLSTVSGFEQLRQDSGTVALSGTFATDTVNVMQGRLIGRTGSTISASTINVASGATFGSAGTVNGNIIIGGTLSPGASPGPMTVTGNVGLAGGSNSLFELTPTVSDQLLISGGLAIASGATLTLTGNRPLAAGSALDLIVAGGGISGSFSTIAKPANIIGFVAQRGNRVQLFGPFAVAPTFTAQVAATIGGVNGTLVTGQASTTLLAKLPGLLTAGGTADPAAFARLNPEAYASASQIGTENGLAIAATLRSTNVQSPLADTGLFSFVQGFGAWRKLGGNATIGTLRGNVATGGAIGGLGVGSNMASASVFVGYLSGHQTIGGLGARTTTDGELVGFNGHLKLGTIDATATVAYDGSGARTRRALPGGSTAAAHYDLHSLIGDISLSSTRPIGKRWSVTPQVGLTHIDTRRGTANETGDTAFALNVTAQHYRADFVDAAISLGADRGNGRWQPWVSAGIRHQLGGIDTGATAAFTGTSSTFTVAGVGRQRTLATGGAGLNWKASDRITVNASYHGEFGSNGTGHHAAIGLRMGF